MSENRRTIFRSQDSQWKIIEVQEQDVRLEDLKGDCYNFEASGYTGTREQLKAEELEFEQEVEREGVYGYILQKWNPKPDTGWEQVDSCWGFVGRYSEKKNNKYHHYIVDELKNQMTVSEFTGS